MSVGDELDPYAGDTVGFGHDEAVEGFGKDEGGSGNLVGDVLPTRRGAHVDAATPAREKRLQRGGIVRVHVGDDDNGTVRVPGGRIEQGEEERGIAVGRRAIDPPRQQHVAGQGAPDAVDAAGDTVDGLSGVDDARTIDIGAVQIAPVEDASDQEMSVYRKRPGGVRHGDHFHSRDFGEKGIIQIVAPIFRQQLPTAVGAVAVVEDDIVAEMPPEGVGAEPRRPEEAAGSPADCVPSTPEARETFKRKRSHDIWTWGRAGKKGAEDVCGKSPFVSFRSIPGSARWSGRRGCLTIFRQF